MTELLVRPPQFENIQNYIKSNIASTRGSKIARSAYVDCYMAFLTRASMSEAVDALKHEDAQMSAWLSAHPQDSAYASVNLRRNAFADVLNFVQNN